MHAAAPPPGPAAALARRQELLPGAWLLSCPRFDDERGQFTKTFAASALAAAGLAFEAREQFVTRSRRGVVRGLHFQRPPHAHAKLVTCLGGTVHDVIVDLRRGPGYGRVASVELSETTATVLYLPEGVAHGFHALTDDALVLYLTSAEHAPSHDAGIHWSSIDHDWGCRTPVLSARDAGHPPLSAFDSPF